MVANHTKKINTCTATRKSWFQKQIPQGGGSESIAAVNNT
jgi:hypothetical protein